MDAIALPWQGQPALGARRLREQVPVGGPALIAARRPDQSISEVARNAVSSSDGKLEGHYMTREALTPNQITQAGNTPQGQMFVALPAPGTFTAGDAYWELGTGPSQVVYDILKSHFVRLDHIIQVLCDAWIYHKKVTGAVLSDAVSEWHKSIQGNDKGDLSYWSLLCTVGKALGKSMYAQVKLVEECIEVARNRCEARLQAGGDGVVQQEQVDFELLPEQLLSFAGPQDGIGSQDYHVPLGRRNKRNRRKKTTYETLRTKYQMCKTWFLEADAEDIGTAWMNCLLFMAETVILVGVEGECEADKQPLVDPAELRSDLNAFWRNKTENERMRHVSAHLLTLLLQQGTAEAWRTGRVDYNPMLGGDHLDARGVMLRYMILDDVLPVGESTLMMHTKIIRKHQLVELGVQWWKIVLANKYQELHAELLMQNETEAKRDELEQEQAEEEGLDQPACKRARM